MMLRNHQGRNVTHLCYRLAQLNLAYHTMKNQSEAMKQPLSYGSPSQNSCVNCYPSTDMYTKTTLFVRPSSDCTNSELTVPTN